ncbi:aminoacyl-tRNA hydrolase [Candidatus Dojkabacteria bacterium]|nr:aminoacyl-tRNA hydrolase [Candidatus Dojkabacteria bacterium]
MFFSTNSTKIKLLLGLGNLDSKYIGTRHNIGFMFLDFLKKQKNYGTFKEDSKLFALISNNKTEEAKILLAKPTTYMNKSGKAARAILDYYKITLENFILIHDDLDIEFGSFKIQAKKSPRSHNGVLSVENNLSTINFRRIRIGIDNRDTTQKKQFTGRDYVLSKFTNDEKKQLEENIFSRIMEEIDFVTA